MNIDNLLEEIILKHNCTMPQEGVTESLGLRLVAGRVNALNVT